MIYIPIFDNSLVSISKPEQVMTFCLILWVFFQTECEKTWYGVNCSQRCVGHCKDNDTCDHVTGQCAGDVMLVGQGLSVIEVQSLYHVENI